MAQDPNTTQARPSADVTLDQLIRTYVERRLERVHTWLPGQVVKVEDAGRTVTVQPQIRFLRNGIVESRPPLPGCRVWVPASGQADANVPCPVGTTGILLFCERPIETWLEAGGETEPIPGRLHDLQDAIFLPGLWPDRSMPAGSSTDWWVKATGDILLQAPGIALKASGGTTTPVLVNGVGDFQAMLALAIIEFQTAATAVAVPTPNAALLLTALQADAFSSAIVEAQ